MNEWITIDVIRRAIILRPLTLLLALLVGGAAGAADWPQPGGNPQHTNFTQDSPAPPYRGAWVADFSPELIYSAQPVIADGRVFQTTLNGRVYALDASTGKRLWYRQVGQCVWSGAAAGTPEHGGAGHVFVAAWEGFIYALDAATGNEVWKYDAGEPLSGSPCVADGAVFIATRKGSLLALGADGRLRWKVALSWNLYNTVAYDQGSVFAVTEDMRVHCRDAQTGKAIWEAGPLWGLCMREFYPVLHQGRVLVALTPALWRNAGGPEGTPFTTVWDQKSKDKLAEVLDRYSTPIDPKATGPESPRRSRLLGGRVPPELEEAQRRLIQFYEKNPHYQTFYVLNAADGKPAGPAVHHYTTTGLENLNMPPAVCADGRLAMPCVFGTARAARLDLAANRWVDFLFEFGNAATDNVEYLSVGGTRIFSKNWIRGGHGQRAGFILDYTSRDLASLAPVPVPKPVRVSCMDPPRRPWGGLSERRLGDFDSGWGLAGTSPASIAGNRFFWIKNVSQLIAYKGAQKP